MRRSASEIIRSLENRIARLEGNLNTRKIARGDVAIETASERDIQKAWPRVSYKGKSIHADYSKWTNSVESSELSEGTDIDLTDDLGNSLEVAEGGQEVYLGYNQEKDFFVMGFDMSFYSQVTEDEWDAHTDAMSKYEDAKMEAEEWDEDEPDIWDFEGYNEDFENVEDPRHNGQRGWAAVLFRVENGRIKTQDPKFGTSLFYEMNVHKGIKRKFNLVDLRLG